MAPDKFSLSKSAKEGKFWKDLQKNGPRPAAAAWLSLREHPRVASLALRAIHLQLPSVHTGLRGQTPAPLDCTLRNFSRNRKQLKSSGTTANPLGGPALSVSKLTALPGGEPLAKYFRFSIHQKVSPILPVEQLSSPAGLGSPSGRAAQCAHWAERANPCPNRLRLA